jgi:spore coat protein A
LPAQGLVVASAERADLLVDFSDLTPGAELTLWNTARAPFDGAFVDPATAGTADLQGLLAYPEVMRLRVVEGQRATRTVPPVLATDFSPLSRDNLEGAVLRAVALVERKSDVVGQAPMLTMRELVEDPGTDQPVITLVGSTGSRDTTTRYRTAATRFEDTVTFFPVLGQPEIWRFVNLTGDTHPIHVHLESFQILDRHPAVVQTDVEADAGDVMSATVLIGQHPDDGIPHALDDNERGLKDTVRVNANEVVDVAVRFGVFAGRYMYHCHILEHEDHDMMRPFVVVPPELMPFMD